MKRLCILLLGVFALFVLTACGGGGGGGTGYIEVSTVEDLNKLRDGLDGSYMLMNDISLSDYSSGDGWLPYSTIFVILSVNEGS